MGAYKCAANGSYALYRFPLYYMHLSNSRKVRKCDMHLSKVKSFSQVPSFDLQYLICYRCLVHETILYVLL